MFYTSVLHELGKHWPNTGWIAFLKKETVDALLSKGRVSWKTLISLR